ncbi:MAG: hypothetical protein ACOX4D_00650 [Bacteroidales bacterium]|jgi:hypothetical protein
MTFDYNNIKSYKINKEEISYLRKKIFNETNISKVLKKKGYYSKKIPLRKRKNMMTKHEADILLSTITGIYLSVFTELKHQKYQLSEKELEFCGFILARLSYFEISDYYKIKLRDLFEMEINIKNKLNLTDIGMSFLDVLVFFENKSM